MNEIADNMTEFADLSRDLDRLAEADAAEMPPALAERAYLASVAGLTRSEPEAIPFVGAVPSARWSLSGSRIAAGLGLMGAIGAVLLATLGRPSVPTGSVSGEIAAAPGSSAEDALWIAVEDAWDDDLWSEIDLIYAETAGVGDDWLNPSDDESLDAWLDLGFGAGGAM
ncbi:MAG: hypothetical protein ACF8SC_06155 [Phycisphaerales bacterium JB037]